MAKYIELDALLAEIKIRQSEHDEKKYGYASSDHFWASVEDGKILSLIDKLEVKEVDLDKEIKKYSMELAMKENNGDWLKDITATAKYFFELGLKAQKGE